jgi:hypothetical protein
MYFYTSARVDCVAVSEYYSRVGAPNSLAGKQVVRFEPLLAVDNFECEVIGSFR